jgi:putative drug exporter of the RND superfamily
VTAPALRPTSDQADFLPDHYESVRAQVASDRSFPEVKSVAAVMVFSSTDGQPLSEQDKARADEAVATLAHNSYPDLTPLVAGANQLSPNGKILLATVTPTSRSADVLESDKIANSITDLRQDAHQLLKDSGLRMGVTGPVAERLDAEKAAGDVDQLVLLATLALIVVLMLLIFRSILLALLPVLTVLVSIVVSSGLIGVASAAFGLQADASIQSLLVVVLFGVGCDYFLFLVFRYRENLRDGLATDAAMIATVRRVGETITSAAAAVIVAFLALTLSSLGQLRAYGPALAIAVAVTLATGLTLIPALVSLLGSKVFWPSRSYAKPARQRVAGSLGAFIGRRPRAAAGAAGLLMMGLAVLSFGFNPQFDQSASGPSDLESTVAQKKLEAGFSAGQTQPTDVIVTSQSSGELDKAAVDRLADKLGEVRGVGAVQSVTLNKARNAANISVVLDHQPTTDAAIRVAGTKLREVAHREAPEGTVTYVGGLSSVLADIQTAVNRDYRVVFPVAGFAILLILALLLRSVVAPWYLMASVALGFGASLGSAVLVFQVIRGQGGLLFTLPILMYLFVVAIGTDYNILMVARIREEVRGGLEPRAAAALAVRHTATTIAAGGIILGGTFSVLTLANDPSLQQMGVGISVGIAVVAFIMAIVLTPALTALLGARAFWPTGSAKTALR